MCGIIGVWNRQGQPVEEADLRAASQTLGHRGPDDEGLWVEGPIGLAHRRLSIIDLSSAGKQPMATSDGRFVLTFNGEIYNYQELRKKYLAEVKLRSESDTEVLLYLLAQKGLAILPELRGMFAFAFWDNQSQKLFLARDPFGKKPLYYAETDRRFVFGSEIKSLLVFSEAAPHADQKVLPQYLLHEYIPEPATGWEGIVQLPAGEALEIGVASKKIWKWWQPAFEPKLTLSLPEAEKELDRLLEQAVARRLIADVPVGVFLSGGLDSTTIAWYMRQQTKSVVHSFSVSFAEKSFNEGEFAQRAAGALGTVHHDVPFGLPEFHTSLSAMSEKIDIPFADASLLPTYWVSRAARQKITVALDGDGSDELFGGYGTFEAARASQLLQWVPKGAWRFLEHISRALPAGYDYFTWEFKLKMFLRGMPYPLARRHQVWLGSFTDWELSSLLTPDYQSYLNQLFAAVDAAGRGMPRTGDFDALSWLVIHHYLSNEILVKLDRATMAVGLEARTPFLDVDLAEFVMKLPPQLKARKLLLKRLMRGRIPAEIIDRLKQGFAIPLGHWLRGPLYDWASGILSEEKLRADGVFQPQAVQQLLQAHRNGKADHRKKLWTLLMWQMWYDRWIAGRTD